MPTAAHAVSQIDILRTAATSGTQTTAQSICRAQQGELRRQRTPSPHTTTRRTRRGELRRPAHPKSPHRPTPWGIPAPSAPPRPTPPPTAPTVGNSGAQRTEKPAPPPGALDVGSCGAQRTQKPRTTTRHARRGDIGVQGGARNRHPERKALQARVQIGRNVGARGGGCRYEGWCGWERVDVGLAQPLTHVAVGGECFGRAAASSSPAVPAGAAVCHPPPRWDKRNLILQKDCAETMGHPPPRREPGSWSLGKLPPSAAEGLRDLCEGPPSAAEGAA